MDSTDIREWCAGVVLGLLVAALFSPVVLIVVLTWF
jgi:hypothetical protein